MYNLILDRGWAFGLFIIACIIGYIFCIYGGVTWANSPEGVAWLKAAPTNGSVATIVVIAVAILGGSRK